MKRLILVLVLLASACTKAPPNLTPVATAEFYATAVIKDLDVVRDFADSASKTTPPLIGKGTLLTVVNWHESLVKVIHASPAGWKSAALAGLTELQGKLNAADQKTFKPYIDGARTTIQELP